MDRVGGCLPLLKVNGSVRREGSGGWLEGRGGIRRRSRTVRNETVLVR
jgi:hypothetical protein